ncbi:MAG: hypothetical protein KIT60_04475 [Burkholderiaceae bacterium]|nr:hypothetical protein [Burkholderiaceae bacterium]
MGSASVTRLVAEMFMAEDGVKALNVAYPGTAPLLTELIGGRVQFIFDVPVTSAPIIEDGRLKALAVTAASGSPHSLTCQAFATWTRACGSRCSRLPARPSRSSRQAPVLRSGALPADHPQRRNQADGWPHSRPPRHRNQ